jgi:sterol 3beta-glucosyltransferase
MARDTETLPWVSLHFAHFGAYGAKAIRERTAPVINRCRAIAGLADLDDPLGADSTSPDLALYAISPVLLRRPSRWPAHHRIVGFFFLDEPGWTPDAALARFLDDGPPPVLITFGSVMHADPDAITGIVARAVEMSGVRAILQHGWSGLGRTPLPPAMLAVGPVPHAWLLPRVACLVHHGGAGTTAAALRAGVPTVVVPHNGDQPIWGQLARELGCAVAPIPYRDLTAERLSVAIGHVMSHASLRAAAERLSARIQNENGTLAACELIEELVSARLEQPSPLTAAVP